jgi:hypothetical protein
VRCVISATNIERSPSSHISTISSAQVSAVKGVRSFHLLLSGHRSRLIFTNSLNAPCIQVGKVLILPLATSQIEVYLDLLSDFVGIDDIATILCELKLHKLGVLTLHGFNHKLPCTKGVSLLLGIVDLVQLSFNLK